MTSLTDELAATIGAEHVLTGPDLMTGYTTDWTRRYQGTATCVARPGTTAQVAAIVQVCARHRVAVVPQGGNTGLVGGAVPANGGVVLSTRRLRRLDPVDTLAGQVTAGAGITVAELQAHAAAAGPSPPTRAACTPSATAGPGPSFSASKRYWPMAVSSRGWAAYGRTTPDTTWPSCWPAVRERSGSSPPPGSGCGPWSRTPSPC
jgi:hypothetical protein